VELESKIPSWFLQYFQVSHSEASNDTTIVNTGRNLEDRCNNSLDADAAHFSE
jgi:hypothetical protein